MPDLIITEHAMKRHCKRVQEMFSTDEHKVSLSEAQNMFAKILGFKDYHHIKHVLDTDPDLDLTNKSDAEIAHLTAVEQTLKKLWSEADSINRGYIELLSKLYIFNRNPRLSPPPIYLGSNQSKAEIDRRNLAHKEFNVQSEALQFKQLREIMNYVSKHKKNINFELTNKEGLPLLYLLIYLRKDTPLRLELLKDTKEINNYYTHPLVYLLFIYYATKDEKDYILSKHETIKSFVNEQHQVRDDLFLLSLRHDANKPYRKAIFVKSVDLPDNLSDICWDCWYSDLRYPINDNFEHLVELKNFLISIGMSYSTDNFRNKYLDTLSSYERAHVIDEDVKPAKAFEMLKVLVKIDNTFMSKSFKQKLRKYPYIYEKLDNL